MTHFLEHVDALFFNKDLGKTLVFCLLGELLIPGTRRMGERACTRCQWWWEVDWWLVGCLVGWSVVVVVAREIGGSWLLAISGNGGGGDGTTLSALARAQDIDARRTHEPSQTVLPRMCAQCEYCGYASVHHTQTLVPQCKQQCQNSTLLQCSMNGVATKQHRSLQDAAECVWAAPFNAQCHSAEAPLRSSMHSVTVSRCPSAAVAQSSTRRAVHRPKLSGRSLVRTAGAHQCGWKIAE
jgi:hypothetical protein